ncbi:uncharacterized protein LOC118750901, partial [Rhagoletis pomonella]|uniref:uncharacterized protein LOC118750901 n=1 Tax=Rhagoletis pomonella TaxID=28610 RepID=UPI00178364FA
MLLYRLQAVIWLFSGVIGLHAYPTINLPLLFGPSAYGEGAYRFKKSGLEIQSDADVVELEHLKDHYGNENADATVQNPTYPDRPFEPSFEGRSVSAEPISESQELERQLEQMPAITTKLEKSTTTELPPAPVVPENRDEPQSPVEGIGMHRPPTLQHDNGGKTLTDAGGASGPQQAADSGTIITGGGSPPAPSAIKTVEALLKRHNGQITPFDMAQYVFWTGDEAGVARAVEELIDRGVMTRENALAFLREVRVGIEYLQQSYTNRIFPEAGLNINIDKK